MTKRTRWDRGDPALRGYGAAWRKLRLRILERDSYLCQVCLATGRVTSAQAVDHITPKADYATGKAKGDPDAPSNLRAICNPCHRLVTLEQQGKTFIKRMGADVRGRPLDPAHHWNKPEPHPGRGRK